MAQPGKMVWEKQGFGEQVNIVYGGRAESLYRITNLSTSKVVVVYGKLSFPLLPKSSTDVLTSGDGRIAIGRAEAHNSSDRDKLEVSFEYLD